MCEVFGQCLIQIHCQVQMANAEKSVTHMHWSLLEWLFSCLRDCRLNDVSLLWQCCPTLQTAGNDDSGCQVSAGLVRAMALSPSPGVSTAALARSVLTYFHRCSHHSALCLSVGGILDQALVSVSCRGISNILHV